MPTLCGRLSNIHLFVEVGVNASNGALHVTSQILFYFDMLDSAFERAETLSRNCYKYIHLFINAPALHSIIIVVTALKVFVPPPITCINNTNQGHFRLTHTSTRIITKFAFE